MVAGTGWLTYFLAKRGYEMVGQDIAPDAIEIARKNPVFCESGSVEFVVSDFDSLEYENEFDAVVFFAALHHTLDEENAIRSAFRVLKKGGVLIASEPGIGHGKKSSEVMEKYNVTDRDMPPLRIIQCGKKIGFREFGIFSMQTR